MKIMRLCFTMILLSNVSLSAQVQLTADVFASYFGGSGDEYMTYVASDPDGNVIIAGHGSSTNLPVKNAYQNTGSSSPDGFIAKFDSKLTGLIFCTYLGGSDYDEIKDVVTDSDGNIYVTGATSSGDFPLTENAYDKTYNGGFDAFLSTFNPNGELAYSTYLGGSANDTGMRIAAVDMASVILTGTTASGDFPFNPADSGAIQGPEDLFLLKLDLTANHLEFSKSLGGTDNETPFCVESDHQNNIYICGYTQSSDFPVKDGFDAAYHGNQDGFLCKFDGAGELIYSSLIGGAAFDQLVGLAIDRNNDVYFMGGTSSSGLACTATAFSSTLTGDTDILLGKVHSSGDSLEYFSYYGGNSSDNFYITDYGDFTDYYCNGKIGLLDDHQLIVTGATSSRDFQVSDGGNRKKSNSEIFVSVLDMDHSETLYFSYFGSIYDDAAYGLTVLSDSTLVVSGNVGPGFQVSSGAYMSSPNGNSEAIFARLTFHPAATGIHKENSVQPTGMQLHQNYPNPFNPSTTIHYSIKEPGKVRMEIHDSLGRFVKILVDQYQSIGDYEINWEGTDQNNHVLPSGVYIYTLSCNELIMHRKMLLIR